MKRVRIFKPASWVKRLNKLYGPHEFIGPFYFNSNGIKRRSATVKLDSGKCYSKQYGKFKLEVKLGRILSKDETVDHIDENPLNDKFSNLQLLTLRENIQKAHKMGTMINSYIAAGKRWKGNRFFVGEKNGKSVFTDKRVKRYRRKFAKKLITIEAIQQKHDCNRKTVLNMLRGITYAHVKGRLLETSLNVGRKPSFGAGYIRKVKKECKTKTVKEVAAMFNRDYSIISKIKNGHYDHRL